VNDMILTLRNATKLYAGVPAIEDVDFDLARGEIHALVGENGAGKSTLTKVMAGVVTLTSGTMTVEGVEAAPKTPLEASQLGIGMVFQENSLVPTMTVAQNLFLGQEKFYNRTRGINIAAQSFLQSLNFDVTPTMTVGHARRGEEADGRNRARGAAQGEGDHLRRADGDADAGGEEIFLRSHARFASGAASRSSSSRTHSKRRCCSPTASPCCATARRS
jgi:ABC-type Fe3+/spermidine/putrescine transport system ATPase subunit